MNEAPFNLWDALGGEAVLTKVVDRFVDLATADPRVNYSRDGRYPVNAETLKVTKQAALEFISAATGGPHPYTGKSLREIHAGMRISENEFNAFMADFQKALRENSVSPELVQALVTSITTTRSQIVEP